MIYLWRIPSDYPEDLIGEYQREGTPNRFLFKKGEFLQGNIGLPIIRFNTTIKEVERFDCLTSTAMVPLVSADLAITLKEIAELDVQLISVRIVCSDGEINDFSLLNIVNKINCINHEISKYKYVFGTQQIMSFQELRYIDDCLNEHLLARDAEYLSHLLVSDKAKYLLTKRQWVGLELVNHLDIKW